MCVFFNITKLLQEVGMFDTRKPVNHTCLVAVVTKTDRPKSVRNRCVINVWWRICVVSFLFFYIFCWYRGFCHKAVYLVFLFKRIIS